MLKYHPYKSDKPNKKYYIITNNDRKVYFGQASGSLPPLILHTIKMRIAKIYILIDTKIMKIG